jgi:antitoxin CcdA
MIEIEKKQVTQDVIVTKICDDCGKKVTYEDYKNGIEPDVWEWQEFYHIWFTGGYGSIFGDGEEVKIDLCQHCLKKRIGDLWEKKRNKE